MGVKSLILYLNRTGFKPDPTTFTPASAEEGACPRRIVIDGSSFIHHVCFAHSDWTFSGDYAILKAYIRCYILLLNLTVGWDGEYRDPTTDFPIKGDIPSRTADSSWLLWVMDGPLPDAKIHTRCERIKQKLETARKVLPNLDKLKWGQKQENIHHSFIPILAITLFLETLTEMGQTVLLADDEADQPSAFYAKRFGAAVISNDSDFIVYDIPLGFLYMPSFFVSQSSLEALSEFDGYLTAKTNADLSMSRFVISMYRNHKVCEHLKINPVHFPLLASLIGNDTTGVVTSQISKLAAVQLKQFPAKRGLTSHNLLTNLRLVGVIGTLTDKSPSQALSEIQNMLGLSSSTVDVIYSSSLSYQIDDLFTQETLRNTHLSEPMSKMLFSLYKRGILTFQAMDMVVHSRFWGLPLIESIGSAPSSWMVSAPLRVLFWSLIGLSSSEKPFQDLIPISNSEIKALKLSRADVVLGEGKDVAFQSLLHVVRSSLVESRVNPRGRFWLLLAFLHSNPAGMPRLGLSDYVPLYSASIHHVAFLLLLRYLAQQLAAEIDVGVLKAFIATYAILCQKLDSPLKVYSAFSVSIPPTAMKYNNQFQTLVLSFRMLWGLVVNGGHEAGPPFELVNRIDSHIFFFFCGWFSDGLGSTDILGPAGCSLFDTIAPFVLPSEHVRTTLEC